MEAHTRLPNNLKKDVAAQPLIARTGIASHLEWPVWIQGLVHLELTNPRKLEIIQDDKNGLNGMQHAVKVILYCQEVEALQQRSIFCLCALRQAWSLRRSGRAAAVGDRCACALGGRASVGAIVQRVHHSIGCGRQSPLLFRCAAKHLQPANTHTAWLLADSE
jgi:hypothetical protein